MTDEASPNPLKTISDVAVATKDTAPAPTLILVSGWVGQMAKQFAPGFDFWASLFCNIGIGLGTVLLGAIAVVGTYKAIEKQLSKGASKGA